ncbi:MAG: hypothetical protein IJD72_07760 [Alistipes sp.]|nr:hypothetical protein [Alistipes sp.]
MKKVTVNQVVEADQVLAMAILNGVAIEDIKAIMRFRAEARPIVNNWNDLIKSALENFKGKKVTQEELNKAINEALVDEIVREVEITPFGLSEDSKVIILSQSKITNGGLDVVLEWVAPEKKE